MKLKLKIWQQIVTYMSLLFAVMIGIAFVAIYLLSEDHRQELFYQRLKDRTISTLKILIEVKEIDTDMLKTFDRNTINTIYDEKILIFNENKELIYSSIDDQKIPYSDEIFKKLIGEDIIVETVEDKYEVVGVEFTYEGKSYYGIAKAYDKFGKQKITYLKNVLLITYFISLAIICFVSYLVARRITHPIERLTGELEKISPDNLNAQVEVTTAEDEIGFLTIRFNDLLKKLEAAFSFQKNFIQHISHELKTPLAIMLTNAERSLADSNPETWKESLEFQRSTTMELAHIINVLIDISKVDTGKELELDEQVRIDELVFECIEEIGYLNPSVNFTCNIDPGITADEQLIVAGKKRMLKLAMLNLLKNAINYSKKEKAQIDISNAGDYLVLHIENDGQLIDENDQNNLFINIFRGKNSQNKKGLGLGLFLTKRIVSIHHGDIYYMVGPNGTNVFTIRVPLAII